jgi:hypothetical protein
MLIDLLHVPTLLYGCHYSSELGRVERRRKELKWLREAASIQVGSGTSQLAFAPRAGRCIGPCVNPAIRTIGHRTLPSKLQVAVISHSERENKIPFVISGRPTPADPDSRHGEARKPKPASDFGQLPWTLPVQNPTIRVSQEVSCDKLLQTLSGPTEVENLGYH